MDEKDEELFYTLVFKDGRFEVLYNKLIDEKITLEEFKIRAIDLLKELSVKYKTMSMGIAHWTNTGEVNTGNKKLPKVSGHAFFLELVEGLTWRGFTV